MRIEKTEISIPKFNMDKDNHDFQVDHDYLNGQYQRKFSKSLVQFNIDFSQSVKVVTPSGNELQRSTTIIFFTGSIDGDELGRISRVVFNGPHQSSVDYDTIRLFYAQRSHLFSSLGEGVNVDYGFYFRPVLSSALNAQGENFDTDWSSLISDAKLTITEFEAE